MQQTFLDHYRAFSESKTDAPKPFVEISGLFCLSAVSQPCKVEYASPTKVNEMFMMIGPSTIGRKGTVTKFARQLLQTGEKTYGIEPVLPTKVLANTGSQEAMKVALNQNKWGYLMAEEFHNQLHGYIKKEYTSDIPQIFINAWDGSPVMYQVRDKEAGTREYRVDDPYLSILSDSQPSSMRNAMDSQLTRTGFFPRFLIAHARVEQEKDEIAQTDEMTEMFRNAREELVKISNYSRDVQPRFKFTTEARELVKKRERGWNQIGRSQSDDVAPFYERLKDHLVRVSGLYAINDWMNTDFEGNVHWIEQRHVEQAIPVIERSIKDWESFFAFICSNQRERNKKNLLHTLRNTPGGMVWRDVQKTFFMKKSDVEEVLNFCTEDEVLVWHMDREMYVPLDKISHFLDGNISRLVLVSSKDKDAPVERKS